MAALGGKYQFKTISDKKDFGLLGIPNYIIEYDTLNLAMSCPLFHRHATGQHQEIGTDDLDVLQLELETMLTDTMKRLRMLKNELNSREIKMLKNNMEAAVISGNLTASMTKIPAKDPDKTFEKYFDRVNFKNRTKTSSRPNFTNLERFVLAPYPVLSVVDTLSRFWWYVYQFHDVTPDRHKMQAAVQFVSNEQYLPRLMSNKSKRLPQKSSSARQSTLPTIDSLAHLIGRLAEHRTPQFWANRPGRLTQRMMGSIVNEPPETKVSIGRLSEASSPHNMERALYQVLCRQEMVGLAERMPQDLTISVRRPLKELNDRNRNRLQRHFFHAFNDLIHDDHDRRLTDIFMELFAVYKILKSSTGQTLADYRLFDELWQRRLWLVRRLNRSNRLL